MRPRIGFAFNRKPAQAWSGREPEPIPASSACQRVDEYAEWDDDRTIAAVQAALACVGEVIALEAEADFPLRLLDAQPDILFNLVEGLFGRNREAHVPAFCEFWKIPYTGSDPLSLSLCLDKSCAKEILVAHGIPTAEFTVVSSADEITGHPIPPVIVKPVHEGSSKGITQASFCSTTAEIGEAVTSVVARYRQPALVERWLPGREFTCAVLGNDGDAGVLPIIELDFEALPPGAAKFYSYEAKWEWDTPDRPLDLFRCPADAPQDLLNRVEHTALAAYRALRCRDWARVDVRCDAGGIPNVIEVNPLPGVLPDPTMNSCFPKAARVAGMDFDAMIQRVLHVAATRYAIILE